jgi:bacterioferritin-associated ferredoxin
MYICICKSVTDKQIRRAAAKGVDNLYELRESLGVTAGCGSCASSAQEILDESATRRATGPTIYVPSAI